VKTSGALSQSDEKFGAWAGVVTDGCRSRSFVPERIFVLPQGEPCVRLAEDRHRLDQSRCTEVAAGREVLLGKEDLPKSLAAPTLGGPLVPRLTFVWGDFYTSRLAWMKI